MTEMHSLKSSNILEIGYDESTGELRVHFKGKANSRYVLSGVPPEVFKDFLESPSPGKFYAQNCAGIFKYRRLAEDEE